MEKIKKHQRGASNRNKYDINGVPCDRIGGISQQDHMTKSNFCLPIITSSQDTTIHYEPGRSIEIVNDVDKSDLKTPSINMSIKDLKSFYNPPNTLKSRRNEFMKKHSSNVLGGHSYNFHSENDTRISNLIESLHKISPKRPDKEKTIMPPIQKPTPRGPKVPSFQHYSPKASELFLDRKLSLIKSRICNPFDEQYEHKIKSVIKYLEKNTKKRCDSNLYNYIQLRKNNKSQLATTNKRGVSLDNSDRTNDQVSSKIAKISLKKFKKPSKISPKKTKKCAKKLQKLNLPKSKKKPLNLETIL
ncbi:unnamed protein product [Moneuplotes crassus]|uniref:Uncharacterized protein n=1 Tax=Euplotes crassus TaxID=5936 RepID=A0AAD1UMU1_EUPCR|nr:unnamed protein product [Moneuplotes crassus]